MALVVINELVPDAGAHLREALAHALSLRLLVDETEVEALMPSTFQGFQSFE